MTGAELEKLCAVRVAECAPIQKNQAIDPKLTSVDQLARVAAETRRVVPPAVENDPASYFAQYRLSLFEANPTLRLGPGYGVQYLRAGTAPGGRLSVAIDTSDPFEMRPGQVFRSRGRFRSAFITRSSNSLGGGDNDLLGSRGQIFATVVQYLQPDIEIVEPDTYPGHIFNPYEVRPGTGYQSTGNASPGVAIDYSAFATYGATRLRLLFDANPSGFAANATSWTVIPWVQHGAGLYSTAGTVSRWYECGSEAFAIPTMAVNPDASNRYRCALLNISKMGVGPNDRIGFQVRDIVPSANTQVGIATEVVE